MWNEVSFKVPSHPNHVWFYQRFVLCGSTPGAQSCPLYQPSLDPVWLQTSLLFQSCSEKHQPEKPWECPCGNLMCWVSLEMVTQGHFIWRIGSAANVPPSALQKNSTLKKTHCEISACLWKMPIQMKVNVVKHSILSHSWSEEMCCIPSLTKEGTASAPEEPNEGLPLLPWPRGHSTHEGSVQNPAGCASTSTKNLPKGSYCQLRQSLGCLESSK